MFFLQPSNFSKMLCGLLTKRWIKVTDWHNNCPSVLFWPKSSTIQNSSSLLKHRQFVNFLLNAPRLAKLKICIIFWPNVQHFQKLAKCCSNLLSNIVVQQKISSQSLCNTLISPIRRSAISYLTVARFPKPSLQLNQLARIFWNIFFILLELSAIMYIRLD